MSLPRTILTHDLLASVVVFFVALPLCMGIALASGVEPALGLITGIVGGLVVGVLAGGPLQVSGPAAGLAVIVYDIVQQHGVPGLGVIVIVAGALQLLAGAVRLGTWFRAVSPAVIQGMLAGIGILIAASQFHVMVDDQPRGSGLQNLASIPDAIVRGFTVVEGTSHHLAAGIGALTIVVVIAWVAWGPKRIPAPLVGVVVATAVAGGFGLPIERVDVPDRLWDSVTLPSLEAVMDVGVGVVLAQGAAVAFIASAETLLCATAVDQMQSGPRTNYDRELLAQGVGNSICGALGALPMTAVIVRSSTNVQSGAQTRASAILHGLWLLVLTLSAATLLRQIPTAVLAAVLVYIGVKLVDVAAIRRMWALARGELVIYAATVAGVVLVDLLSGVLLGLGLSAVRLLIRLTESHVDVRSEGRHHTVVLHGTATFLNLPKIARHLEALPDGEVVHLRLEKLAHIDHACMELLASFEKRYVEKGGEVSIEWGDIEERYWRSRRRATEFGLTPRPESTP
jgi:MFS superfamily sulfate permease-like transporter